MVTVPLGLNAYKRDSAGAPDVRLANRYVEKSPTNLQEHVALLARPGTELLVKAGNGSIRGVFSKEGMFDDDLFIVSGTALYRYDGTNADLITGTVGDADWIYTAWMKGTNYKFFFISANDSLQVYNGSTLASVALPDSQDAKALTALAGFVLVSAANTPRFYWIEPGEVTIDALNFATKESNPDNILDMLTVGDQALIFGGASTEAWYATGDVDAPFAPTAGHAYARGVVEGTPVVVNESVILVGNDGIVYDVAGGVRSISDNGIAERVRKQLAREAGL